MNRTSPPPDILHVIHGLTVGGAEVDLVGKLRILRRDYGYPVTVCCLMRRGTLTESLEGAGGRVIGPLMRHRRDARVVGTLRHLLLSRPWDLVHSHLYEGNVITGLALATIPRRLRPGWIVAEHSMAEIWGRVPLLVDRIMARQARAFLVPTESAAKSFAARGVARHRLRVLPNGIDTRAFPAEDAEAARRRVRDSLGIGEGDILLGTICRLHALKGLPVLFEAAASLPVRVVVAGDGPARDDLAALIASRGWSERIRLLGTRTEVPELLAAFDLFVLPSLSESMSIAVAEALLAGTPVVATRTGGVPELTGDGRYATLVSPGDVVALRAAITHALADLPAARIAAAAGGDWVRERLGLESIVRRLHELYREVSTSR